MDPVSTLPEYGYPPNQAGGNPNVSLFFRFCGPGVPITAIAARSRPPETSSSPRATPHEMAATSGQFTKVKIRGYRGPVLDSERRVERPAEILTTVGHVDPDQFELVGPREQPPAGDDAFAPGAHAQIAPFFGCAGDQQPTPSLRGSSWSFLPVSWAIPRRSRRARHISVHRVLVLRPLDPGPRGHGDRDRRAPQPTPPTLQSRPRSTTSRRSAGTGPAGHRAASLRTGRSVPDQDRPAHGRGLRHRLGADRHPEEPRWAAGARSMQIDTVLVRTGAVQGHRYQFDPAPWCRYPRRARSSVTRRPARRRRRQLTASSWATSGCTTPPRPAPSSRRTATRTFRSTRPCRSTDTALRRTRLRPVCPVRIA